MQMAACANPLVTLLLSLERLSRTAKQIFPGKELRRFSPNSYIHVSVSDLCIYSSNRSAYSAAGK
jgi:hypothetical protein